MDGLTFDWHGVGLCALASRALWVPGHSTLIVSDLHMGKAERTARRGGALLPPFETRDTLDRLRDVLSRLGAKTVVCLGDSFDDAMAEGAIPGPERAMLAALQLGRDWVWVAGNHEGAGVGPGGRHVAEVRLGPLTLRHIADPGQVAEISGHYHPKWGLGGRQRPCFAIDGARIVMPAFGTYTGGLSCADRALSGLMGPGAITVLTGERAVAVPFPVARPRKRA
ncbi:MAG: ligase-associated DNA damage response endonuclease PdeM [Paracoccaceae bacterium]